MQVCLLRGRGNKPGQFPLLLIFNSTLHKVIVKNPLNAQKKKLVYGNLELKQRYNKREYTAFSPLKNSLK